MNAEETARLLVLVSEFCPQQVFTAADEDHGIPGSAAMWASVLDDVAYRDAALAVQRLVKKQRFIAVSEVRETVAAIRAERLDTMPIAQRPVPNVDPNDTARYVAGVRAIERAIADGDIRSDGNGGYVLPNARWQHAIESGPTVEREVDYSEVFVEQRAALRAKREDGEQERTARAVEAAERQRQLDALAHMIEGYEKTRAGKLARKRRLGKTITKPLAVVADDGATMEEPQAERDAAAS